jgi:hypothetical protein
MNPIRLAALLLVALPAFGQQEVRVLPFLGEEQWFEIAFDADVDGHRGWYVAIVPVIRF